MRFGLVLGALREGVRRSVSFFGLDVIRKQSNFIIAYFNKAYLEGRKDIVELKL